MEGSRVTGKPLGGHRFPILSVSLCFLSTVRQVALPAEELETQERAKITQEKRLESQFSEERIPKIMCHDILY